MTVRVTRRYRFSASHRLHSDQLNDQQNDRTYGKCNNPHGHGHNYVLEVTVAGPVDSQTGLAVDGAALDQLVYQEIIRRYDHRNLNEELPEYRDTGLVPTTENVLACVEDRLQRAWHPGWPKLARVRLLETNNNTFERQLT